MCGRFTQSYSWAEVHSFLTLIGEPPNLRPRYNVAPSQQVAVGRADEEGRRPSMLRWGLIPVWAKDASIGYKLINARSETAASKPSFRAAFKTRRCVIPVDGFYEWKREGAGKQPYRIHMQDGGVFVFAGLWEAWVVPQGAKLTGNLVERRPGDEIESCTILTTAANEFLSSIHGRMPVILELAAVDAWLAGDDVPLGPYPSERMAAHPVSTRVNSPRNDDPELVAGV